MTAFLWLPASVHCQIEALPGLEFLHCSAEVDSGHNPVNDCTECCSVEKSQYCSGELRLAAPAPVLVPLLFLPSGAEIIDLPVTTGSPLTTVAPPDLLQRRQFLSRTALPVRAPAIAS